jgi:hypothetical protein
MPPSIRTGLITTSPRQGIAADYFLDQIVWRREGNLRSGSDGNRSCGFWQATDIR